MRKSILTTKLETFPQRGRRGKDKDGGLDKIVNNEGSKADLMWGQKTGRTVQATTIASTSISLKCIVNFPATTEQKRVDLGEGYTNRANCFWLKRPQITWPSFVWLYNAKWFQIARIANTETKSTSKPLVGPCSFGELECKLRSKSVKPTQSCGLRRLCFVPSVLLSRSYWCFFRLSSFSPNDTVEENIEQNFQSAPNFFRECKNTNFSVNLAAGDMLQHTIKTLILL